MLQRFTISFKEHFLFLLKFFEGGITLKNMLSHVENIESGLDDIKNAKSISDLHKICTENDVYKF